MSNSIIELDDKKMLYHLFQSGLTGYWCAEAKIFLKESLNQFKNKKQIDLNKLDSVQSQFIKVMKNMEYSQDWGSSNGVEICLEMEIWDYVFSVSEICSDFLFSLGIKFDGDTLDNWIRTYHPKGKNVNIIRFFANNPEVLKWVQFRIYHLPKTLRSFDKIAQGYSSNSVKTVREILIQENFQQMQESYKFWGNADYLKEDTNSFINVLYEYKNRESNKENEPLQEEVVSNIPVKSPVINIIDRLSELKKYPFELSDMGLKLLNFEKFENNENHTKYYIKLITFGFFLFILSAVLSLIHPLFMLPALLSGLAIRYTIIDWKEARNTPIILKTPEYHFFDSLEQSEQYLNILSLILSNQEYAIRLQKFINYDLDLKTKSQRFPQAFADVFEKWDNLGNPNIYQQILDMGKLKQSSLTLLKELTPQLSQESENTFIFQLEQQIRESQDIPQLEKWHTVLNQSSLDAMQGITVRLEKNYFLN